MTASIKSTINSASESKEISYDDSKTQLGVTNVQDAIEKVNSKVNSSKVEIVIERSKWSGNKYSLENEYPFNQYDIYILDFGSSATETEMSIWNDAMIKGSITENVLTTMSTTNVPKVDIPIIIELVKK